jgi:gliding motility-associated-like protein
MKKFLLLLFVIVLFQETYAQCGDPNWVCMQTSQLTVGDGWTVSDDGGGSPYTDTDYTLTLCPDVPGDVVSLVFSAFALQTSPNANNSDYLSIFDGDDTSAPSLGDYTGNSIQGLSVTGTVNNTSGCLTLVFSANGLANAGSPGFEAQVTTTTPCASPTSNSAITNPAPVDPLVQTVNVCLDIPISFSSAGSVAAPGFTLANYIWNFDDGTVLNTGSGPVSHSFSEPGEYVVTLTVEDNNGCQSLNIIPLQVLVSTYPIFTGMQDLETCLGQVVQGIAVVGSDNALDQDNTIGGGVVGETWTALPPQVVAGETYLADGAGFSYSTSLTFDFFEPDATLETCDDLLNVFVNMEHSYMGDLGVYLTCPNGTVVDLVSWGDNGGGGTFLGEAIDDGSTDPGVGYDYYWEPDANNGTWGANAGGTSLPSGVYQSYDDMCTLVGCPLNGDWTFTVTDNLAIDNGYIFAWGIAFNPILYPGVTTFTPTIGAGADSSYWVTTGAQWITDITPDADIITIDPEQVGVYDYTYVVINNFGCTFDTTITLTVYQAPLVTAGMDAVMSCGEVELQGGLIGEPPIPCSNCGDYTFCYEEGGSYNSTFCPDNMGEGVITVLFESGSVEEFADWISFYDGPNTWPSPFISNYTGDLTGLSITATNPDGCITVAFWDDWGGLGGCGDGVAEEWNFTVTASSIIGSTYVWEWSPADDLSNANVPNPIVGTIGQTTTFTLESYPAGHPGCSSSDQVVVSIDPLGDPGLDNGISVCSNDADFPMLNELGGTPVATGVWTDPAGNVVPAGVFSPTSMLPGVYTYTVAMANCSNAAVLDVSLVLPTTIEIVDDTTLCYATEVDLQMYDLNNGATPFSYAWSYNGAVVSNSPNYTFIPASDGQACLAVIDGCGLLTQDCMDVTVEPQVTPTFTAVDPSLCWPEVFELQSTTDATLYTSMNWEMGDGESLLNMTDLIYLYEEPGTYDVTLRVTTPTGCIYTTTENAYLTSFAPPHASFQANPQPTDATNTLINFDESSTGDIVDYSWTFGNPAIGTSSQPDPSFNFPLGVGGIYEVDFVVTDVNGCTDQVIGYVDINDIFQIYVPNSFTPNNDGVNDVFFVSGADIDPNDFEFSVFNRWGEVVFTSKDPNKVWTGEVKEEGEFYVPNGTYNWIARIGSLSTSEVAEMKGYIHVFR